MSIDITGQIADTPGNNIDGQPFNPDGTTGGGIGGGGGGGTTNSPPPSTMPTNLTFNVFLTVVAMPEPVTGFFDTVVNVYPARVEYAPALAQRPIAVQTIPLKLHFKSAFIKAFQKIAEPQIQNFFDIAREGKTLLNFGNDYQALITHWQYDRRDASTGSMVVKLYEPLPDDVDLKTQLWVSRELSPPVIDRLHILHTPPPPPKVYLRPANRNIQLTGRSGVSVQNVTMNALLSPTAQQTIDPSDPTVNEWFTEDVNAAELNINYGDYREFVFFGSAASRLTAFVNKLLQIENLTDLISSNSGSLTYSGSVPTNRLGYPAIQNLSDQRTEVFRSFDAYERFLYYGSGSAYSASLTGDDVGDDFRYHADCTWPKINGSVAPVASASVWINTQMEIAEAYDSVNVHRLANNLPEYLQNDANSADFVQFTNLVGHHFDTLKVYIDHMTNIHDRSSDPNSGISPDLIWNVAKAHGVELPNQYALANLMDFTVGDANVSPKVYRQVAAETWKRFMHNQIHMMKAKGTKTALRALANTYGIQPTTLQIRELGTVGTADAAASFDTFEEQTNVLNIVSGSFIQMPWTLSSSVAYKTIELRFASPERTRANTLLHADSTWALISRPVSGTFGQLIVSGSGVAISSSVLPIYSGDFYSVMVRQNASKVELQVKRAEADSIVESSTTLESGTALHDLWPSASALILGSSASAFGNPFAGQIDEFRVWGETTTDVTFDLHVKYPGLYNGNQVTSVRDSLYVRLSFNRIGNLGVSGSTAIFNESPSFRGQAFSAINFPNIPSAPYNTTVLLREVTRYNPTAGAQFSSNKITIADPPVLKYIGSGSVPVLSPNNSIVSLTDKATENQNSNFIGFYFSVTDTINDNITRAIGTLDLQTLLGDPADQFSTRYQALEQLNELYWTQYAYNYNVNNFVDFVENLLEPLFSQAKQLVPARAKLLSGIVHEPHFLERAKAPLKPIEVSAGSKTKKNSKDTQNLEAEAVSTQPDSIIGTTLNHASELDVLTFSDVAVELGTQDGTVDVPDIYSPLADIEQLEALVDLPDVLTPSATTPNYDSALFSIDDDTISGEPSSYEAPAIAIVEDYIGPAGISLFELGGIGLTPMIQPYTNFDDVESYTYFMDPQGLVATQTIEYERVNQNVLNARGTWTYGTTYAYNDFVEQLGSVNAPQWNGYEYRCVSTDKTFVSYIEPSLDPANWIQMAYTPVAVAEPKRALLIDNAVTLAPLTTLPQSGSVVTSSTSFTGSGYFGTRWFGHRYFGHAYFGSLPQSGSVVTSITNLARSAVVGYRPEHYKFTRDTRQGTIRHQWLGCKQDETTTPDGKPPVEVKGTGGSSLFVANGDPIQPPDDSAGPILDVR